MSNHNNTEEGSISDDTQESQNQNGSPNLSSEISRYEKLNIENAKAELIAESSSELRSDINKILNENENARSESEKIENNEYFRLTVNKDKGKEIVDFVNNTDPQSVKENMLGALGAIDSEKDISEELRTKIAEKVSKTVNTVNAESNSASEDTSNPQSNADASEDEPATSENEESTEDTNAEESLGFVGKYINPLIGKVWNGVKKTPGWLWSNLDYLDIANPKYIFRKKY